MLRCHWRPETAEWEVWAPAKLNLFLEVLSKRADGYHELETLMTPINLYDILYVREEAFSHIHFQCEPSACGQLPTGGDNLVVRAVERLRQHTGEQRGLSIRLVKRIPLAAGLAGGSSDAAAALVAACAVWNSPVSPEEVSSLAAQLGSDVPFFLQSKAALCLGRGEIIRPVPRSRPLPVVVVRPAQGLSTAQVFGACRPASEPQSSQALVAALKAGNAAQVGRLLHNRLWEPAARLCPELVQLQKKFDQLDLLGHSMSGSGTSYFGICRSPAQARRAAARLRSWEVGKVFVVHTR